MELQSICFHILRKCNLECTHCWTMSSPKGREILNCNFILNFAADMVQHGLKHVSLSGGEPLLHSDLGVIVKNLIKFGLKVSITTNGPSGKNTVNKLIELGVNPSDNLKIRVSIDGGKLEHNLIRGKGSYEKAIDTANDIPIKFGSIGINSMLIGNVEKNFQTLINDLTLSNIFNWALIMPSTRGRYKTNVFSYDELLNRANSVKLLLNNNGISDSKISIWDYNSSFYDYVLVEVDGRILIPGVTENKDIIVGNYNTTSGREVKEAVNKVFKSYGYDHFSWNQW